MKKIIIASFLGLVLVSCSGVEGYENRSVETEQQVQTLKSEVVRVDRIIRSALKRGISETVILLKDGTIVSFTDERHKNFANIREGDVVEYSKTGTEAEIVSVSYNLDRE
uniref:Lipoprotein n=1 Tax=uncultured Alphaproteobacteria bacterium TaxID=91750 RepID=A0A6G8F378_9PROT|nr:hypothetical protein PlAlph_5860 [uncultured Alphaproteobacteria bacterium]